MSWALGSPPRVRGIEVDDLLELYERRITPACAGNSIFVNYDDFYDRDHPRVCGE